MNNFLDNQLEFQSFWDVEPNYKSNVSVLAKTARSYYSSGEKYIDEYSDPSDSKHVKVSGVQLSLELETVDEITKNLKQRIDSFKNYEAYRCIYSNRWENLMVYLSKEPDLLDTFKDIMVMLKLRGYSL